jgi:hypothetical protein
VPRLYILNQIAPPTSVQTSFHEEVCSSKSPRSPVDLGGAPTFPPSNPVPQIFPSGYGYVEEYNAVISILRNEPNPEPTRISSRQRYVLSGTVKPGTSYRSDLQRRVTEFLDLDANTTSVVCVTTGMNALRAALKLSSLTVDQMLATRSSCLQPPPP